MIYVVTRRLLAYYYADPVYMLRVSRYHGITIVSTHSRPTQRLPVFIPQTFYVFDVIFCIIIRTNKHLLDYVTSTQITLFTCIHYAYLSYTLDDTTMYPQFIRNTMLRTCNNTDIECCQLSHVPRYTTFTVCHEYTSFHADTLLYYITLFLLSSSLLPIVVQGSVQRRIVAHCLIVYRTCMTYCNLLSRNNADYFSRVHLSIMNACPT